MAREKFYILDTWENTLMLWSKKLEQIQINIDARDILVQDSTGNFTSTNLEDVLAEIQSNIDSIST